jgi:glutathione S-transferase
MEIFIDWFERVWKPAPNAIEATLGDPHPAAGRIEELGALMQGRLSLFDQLLQGRDFLFGSTLSAADCIAFPFLKFALVRDPADDELFHRILDEHQTLGAGHAALARWIERVDALPRA